MKKDTNNKEDKKDNKEGIVAAATSGDFGPMYRIKYIKHMRPEFYEALEIYAPSVITNGATAEELEELAKDFDPSHKGESPPDIETLMARKLSKHKRR